MSELVERLDQEIELLARFIHSKVHPDDMPKQIRDIVEREVLTE